MSLPTDTESQVLRDVSDAEEVVAAFTWPEQDGPDLFGIEVEAFPLQIDENGPAGRLLLHDGTPSVVDVVTAAAARSDAIGDRLADSLAFPTAAGGRVTFEPGAQIEHSSAPGVTSAVVRAEMTEVWGTLRDAFWEHQVCLLSLGVDPWHDASTVPQQLVAPRYKAMDHYFGARGAAGAVMMRNTCSVQVNVDAGNGATRRERWLAANLLSPLLTAMFATSPGPGVTSRRAQVWQSLDPTRTGFPSWAQADDADPLEDVLARALSADVMYITRNEVTTPGRPGWTFKDWLREGHPTAGRPTVGDLETHLTTLFTEVRPRGSVLEMRGIDGLTEAWWHVPLVTVAALLYDPASRSGVIELLEPHAASLDNLWNRAAVVGLADPQLGALASSVATLAMSAAKRDPACFDHADTSAAAAFFEEFTMQGRSPADILRAKLSDPAAALAWAAPEHTLKGAA